MEPTSYNISVKTEISSTNKTEVIGKITDKVTEVKTESKVKATRDDTPQYGTLQKGSELDGSKLKESEINGNELRNDSKRTSIGILKEHKMTEQINEKITASNTTKTTLTKRQKYMTTTILFYVMFAYVCNSFC